MGVLCKKNLGGYFRNHCEVISGVSVISICVTASELMIAAKLSPIHTADDDVTQRSRGAY